MISIVQPLPVGNALRLFLSPPAGAVAWKILRKGSDTFSGHDDASALQVYAGDELVVVDTVALQNDVMAFYRPFYTSDGATWTPGPTAFGTPSATYAEQTVDVLSTIRRRIEAGLKVECDRGNFMMENGYIQVTNAAPAMTPDLLFPLVTIHLESEDPGERAIGEMVGIDTLDYADGDWQEAEGWLAAVRLTAIGWCLNADERLELRKAIRRVLIANLPVFESHGWTGFSVGFQDVDSLSGEYSANVYQVLCSISCTAPVVVTSKAAPIDSVDITLTTP
jgi:hypothetical protein